jgi:hypothetical protein
MRAATAAAFGVADEVPKKERLEKFDDLSPPPHWMRVADVFEELEALWKLPRSHQAPGVGATVRPAEFFFKLLPCYHCTLIHAHNSFERAVRTAGSACLRLGFPFSSTSAWL